MLRIRSFSGLRLSRRSPGATLVVAVAGIATSILVIAQVNVVLAAVLGVGILLAALVVVFSRVEYVLHVLVVIPLLDGLELGPISIGRVASVGALGVVIGLMILTDWRPMRTPLRLWVPAVALLSWGVLSGLWARSVGDYLFGIGQLGMAASVLVVTALCLRGVATFTAVLRTYVIVAALTVIPATAQAIAGSRAVGLHANANAYAQALVMAILALAYLVKIQGFRSSSLWLVIAPVLLWGTLITGSRAGLLALVGALLLISYDFAPRRNRAVVMAAAAAVVAVGFLAVVTGSERFDPQDALEDRGASRLDIWLVGVRQVENAPLHGMGLKNFRSESVSLLTSETGVAVTGGHLFDNDDGVTMHNQYLDFLVNLGIIGLGLYLWMIGRSALAMWHANPEWQGAARTVLLQMLFVVTFKGMFGSSINSKHLWMLIGASIAMNALPSRGDVGGSRRAHPSLGRREPHRGLQVR